MNTAPGSRLEFPFACKRLGRAVIAPHAAVPLLLAALFSTGSALADGCFVHRWDSRKDINEPAQKAILVHDAGRQDLILQVRFEGAAEEFGWLVPVPALPDVEKSSMDCFYELSQFTQRPTAVTAHAGLAGTLGSGRGVIVHETKTVGAYEIAVLSSENAGSLEEWIKAQGFAYPPNLRHVIQTYIDQGWYFVAVRISIPQLRQEARRTRDRGIERSIQEQLSAGELHPLRLSFASEKPVFPLKISAVNGKPSEVSLYVIAREPLAASLLLQKQVEKQEREHARWAEERKASSLKSQANMSLLHQAARLGLPLPLPQELQSDLQALALPGQPWGEKLSDWDRVDLVGAWQVTVKDLPKCALEMPRLRKGSWFLTKQSWTFAPEEMEDLYFAPVVPAMAALLKTRQGLSAVSVLVKLRTFQPLDAALQSADATERICGAFALNYVITPHAKEQLSRLIQDPEPEVRCHAIRALASVWHPRLVEPLMVCLRDTDEDVSVAAASVLRDHVPDWRDRLPDLFGWLQDSENPVAQKSVLHLLSGIPNFGIPRNYLLGLLNCPRPEVVMTALQRLEWQGHPLRPGETAPMLSHPAPLVRAAGLEVLHRTGGEASIQDCLRLLTDSNGVIRLKAGQVLQRITGQTIPYGDPERWQQWWAEAKANY